MDAILEQVESIFRDVLDNDKIKLDKSSSAQNIDDWDSLNHIQLVVAIEKHFRIKFPTLEIQKWKNVGDMCESIRAKLPANS
ncbi:MAG TPA: acyl carrier protein [Puia sp.]|nr:acyl carrier protein [Puia sp.]